MTARWNSQEPEPDSRNTPTASLRPERRRSSAPTPSGGQAQTRKRFARGLPVLAALGLLLPLGGCGPNYNTLRTQGLRHMDDGDYRAARRAFLAAEDRYALDAADLHNLGLCYLHVALDHSDRQNRAATLREIDRAVSCFQRALDLRPEMLNARRGLNVALEMKGYEDRALATAEWGAEYVGPDADHLLYLATELEQRGDLDQAYLRYRQAIAIDLNHYASRVRFAKFLFQRNSEQAAVRHLQAAYRINPAGDEWVLDSLIKYQAIPNLSPAPAQPSAQTASATP